MRAVTTFDEGVAMGNLYEIAAVNQLRQSPVTLLEKLTRRQLEVLALLCEGLPNKAIGRRLNISSATVKIHVAHILRALNVSSRLQAVIVARSLGLEIKTRNAEAMRPETDTASRYPLVLRLLLGEHDPEGGQAVISSWSPVVAAG